MGMPFVGLGWPGWQEHLPTTQHMLPLSQLHGIVLVSQVGAGRAGTAENGATAAAGGTMPIVGIRGGAAGGRVLAGVPAVKTGGGRDTVRLIEPTILPSANVRSDCGCPFV
jgi:hypothetical protein